jgi:hypothetical protein
VVLKRITKQHTSFVAIHFQEVGGKNLAESDLVKSEEALANVDRLCRFH